MDVQVSRKSYLPSLNPCGSEVERIATLWVATKGLKVLTREISPERVLIHASAADTEGYFEILYRMRPESAVAEINYCLVSGTVSEPPLPASEINAFADSMEHAIQCDKGH
jgi:hypothetical protein